ncbi:cation:proton antiporter [Streptomyces sp. NBC_01485]|uniref:cation:proton antiporter n=1 Tax=Streptomyces sp. NBC_01485 TaxID=2903884 RepID=UPI002E3781A5|nr:cation:proton antiporter [Streptomyces sp. NBC_01485]
MTVLLLFALALGRAASRFGMPAVVGELLTGVLLGPSVLGWTAPGLSGRLWPEHGVQPQLMDALSLVGVLLFVGVSGAHLDLRMLRRRPRTVLSVSGCALLLPLGLGVAAGLMLPAAMMGPHASRPSFALLLGVVMGVSAIPVIAKTLTDLKMLHRDIGQLTLVAAAGQDVVAWLLLSVVSAMTVSGFAAGDLAESIAHLALFLLAAWLLRPVARAGLRRAQRAEGSAPAIGLMVITILGSAAVTQALGLEAALGAFVAGCLLSSPSPELAARLAPLRSVTLAVFAPIFLAGAGLHMDLRTLRDPGTLTAGAIVIVLAISGKFAGAYLGARLGGLTRAEGLALGAGLNARGAVEVVVATVGLRIGVIGEEMYSVVILTAVLTSVMAPPVLRWAMAKVEHRSEERLREVELSAWSDSPATSRDPAQN